MHLSDTNELVLSKQCSSSNIQFQKVRQDGREAFLIKDKDKCARIYNNDQAFEATMQIFWSWCLKGGFTILFMSRGGKLCNNSNLQYILKSIQNTYVRAYVRACVCTSACVCVRTCMCTWGRTYVRTCMYTPLPQLFGTNFMIFYIYRIPPSSRHFFGTAGVRYRGSILLQPTMTTPPCMIDGFLLTLYSD